MVIRSILTIAFLIAVGGLEMALSGATFEEVAGGLLGLTAEASKKVRFIGPWLLLIAEVFLAMAIVHEDMEHIPGDSRFSACRLVRWGLLLMMITLTAAAQISRLPEADSGAAVTAGFWLKMVGLVAATSVLHTLVLYSRAPLRGFCLVEHRPVARQQLGQGSPDRGTRPDRGRQ
jgi:hypothetical protein